MKKRLLIRSLIGLVAGAMMAHLFTLLSNQLTKGVWLLCMPGLTEEIGFVGAVILQTVLGALFGAVAFGGICFFDIESWSLLRSSAVHCVTILVSYLTVGLILRWFSPHIIPIRAFLHRNFRRVLTLCSRGCLPANRSTRKISAHCSGRRL
jgi:MFS family permease